MTPEARLQQQAVMQHLSLTNGLLLVALSVALVTPVPVLLTGLSRVLALLRALLVRLIRE